MARGTPQSSVTLNQLVLELHQPLSKHVTEACRTLTMDHPMRPTTDSALYNVHAVNGKLSGSYIALFCST